MEYIINKMFCTVISSAGHSSETELDIPIK